MRKILAVVLTGFAVMAGARAEAPGNDQAVYLTGSLQAVKAGAAGTLDTSPASELVFHSGASQFSIPYAQVVSYQLHEQRKAPLGVLPTIAIALVVWPPKVYQVTVTWHGEDGVSQVAIFELPKTASEGLMALLKARATEACKPKSGQLCGRQY
jgi:hypothetical protein